MRLGLILLVVVASQLHVENASAASRVLSTPGDNLNTRLLRTAVNIKYYNDDNIDDDGLEADNEERMVISATYLKKMLENEKIMTKMLENKNTMKKVLTNENILKSLSKDRVFRRQMFAQLDKAGHTYSDVKKAMTDPKLLRYYFNYLDLGPLRRAKRVNAA